MSRFIAGRGRNLLALLFALLGGACQLGSRPELQTDPPRLIEVSLHRAKEQVPTDPIRLSFSKALDPARVEPSSVAVVPYQPLAICAVDLDCAGDRCHERRCQRNPVSGGWLADMANPPLSAARLSQTAPATLRLDGQTDLLWEPLEPLAPHRLHALLVGPGLTDDAGTPVVLDPGSRLVLQEVFATAPAETGRPLLALASPLDGALDVPPNLKRVLVIASRPVLGVEPESLFVKRSDGRRVAARLEVEPSRCAAHPLGTCFELRLLEPLPPRQRLELGATEAIRDLRGRPVLLGRPPAFTTSLQPDHDPPHAGPLRLQVSDRCAVIRLRLDEPADLHLRPSWGALERWSLAGDTHEVVLTPPNGKGGELKVELEDLAGNLLQLTASTVPPGDISPRVVITEVLAHPMGPEPAQEFVELVNLEPTSVSLEGWSIDDDEKWPARNPLPAVTLQPGQLAVVAGPKFDALLQDPPLAAGALLIRLGQTLGTNGLSNSGEPLMLRDQQGRLVSSYLGVLPGTLKKGRSIERIDPAGCDVAENWRLEPSGRSSPGMPPARQNGALP